MYHSIETGSGYDGLAAFCTIINMPPHSKPAYYKQVDNILARLEDEAAEEMSKPGERFQQYILDESPDRDKDGTHDALMAHGPNKGSYH